MSRIEQITARAALTTDQLAKLGEEHEALLLALVEAGDDVTRTVVEQQLTQVSGEKAACENKLAGLRMLIQKENTLNSAEGKRATFAEVEALFKRVQHKRATDCAAAGEAMLRAIGSLALPIAQWQHAKEQLAADTRAVLTRTCDTEGARRAAYGAVTLANLDDGRITDALARALYSTGLGAAGPNFGTHLSLTEPSRTSQSMPLSDALALNMARLVDHLRTHVDRAAAELDVAQ